MNAEPDLPPFARLVDLAAERVGGRALLANDEFFAPKENLLRSGRGIFEPSRYTDHGKWMDGWETRRRREPGHDWCIVRLGLPGRLRGVDIDTNYFLGNHPPEASLDACALPEGAAVEEATWTEVLPRSPLGPGQRNFFALDDDRRWTHVRLNIYPDGGVARLRVFGEAVPDWRRHAEGTLVDLAALENGGVVAGCSDRFFSEPQNLLMPGPPSGMHDGWETRRRRGPGHDWAVVRLGAAGHIGRLEVDTTHFKGNAPGACAIEGLYLPPDAGAEAWAAADGWTEILPRRPLMPHRLHLFSDGLREIGPCSHVRLNIYPDGGVARLRVFGRRLGEDER